MSTANKLELILALTVQEFDKGVKLAVASVNTMVGSIGSAMKKIDTDFKTVILASQKFRESMDGMNGTASNFRGQLLGIATALGGANLFQAAGKSAFSFNQTIEQSKIGIAALIRTFTTADMGQSFTQAEDIQKRLQIAGLRTTATYEQLLKALQEGIGPALREGFNPQQIVAFSQGMTQAAAALSVPMDQLGQELRAILDGTVSADARIAKALQIDNKIINEWKSAGTLFDNLQKKLAAFVLAGDQAANTFGGALSNMMDAIQMALGKGTEKTFGATTSAIKKVQEAIVEIDEKAGTFTFNTKIMAALDDIDRRISAFLASITGEQIANALTAIVQVAGAVVDVLGSLGGAVIAVVDALGPMAGDLVALVGNLLIFSAGWKVLAFALTEPYGLLVSMGVALNVLAGTNVVVWLSNFRNALSFSAIAAGGFATIISGLGGVLAAFMAGVQIGRWLYAESDIVKKAGNRIAASFTWIALKAKEAWAWISGGDTEAVQREIDEAKKIYDELYREIGSGAKESAKVQKTALQEVSTAAGQAAEKHKQVTASALEEMKRKYKEYAGEIKRLQGEILGVQMDADQKLRELARTGMSEKDAWEDKKKQAQEYATVAKIAGEAGRLALQGGNVDLAKDNFKTSKEYAELAKAKYLELGAEVKNGDKIYKTQEENIKMVTKVVNELVAGEVENIKAMQGELVKSQDDLIKKSGFQDLAKGLGSFEEDWLKRWKLMQSAAVGDIEKVEERLVQLVEKNRTVWVNVKERQAQSTGGLVGYMRGGLIRALAAGGSVVRNILAGGFLPGFGGGDTVPLLGERGEVMLNKYAVKAGGLRAALAFNSGNWAVVIDELLKRTQVNIGDMLGYHLGGAIGGMMQPVQALAGGGEVSGSAARSSGMIRHEHILKIGNTSAKVYTDDLNAGRLLAVLERAKRMAG